MTGIELRTARLTVRSVDESCSEMIAWFHARNRAFHEPWVPRRSPEFYTRDGQREILARERAEMLDGRRLKVWLFATDAPRIVGFIDFSEIIRGFFQSCFLGYALDKGETGKGYMTESLEVAIGRVFDVERLHRIEANVMPRNSRSMRLLERLGFRNEGLARHYLLINGTWEDHVHMTLLNDRTR